MTISRIGFAAVVMILAAGGSSARAASFEHIDSLALELQAQARELYNEFRIHYAHSSHAPHLRSDAAQMYRLASHIHELAHFRGGLDHMAADLRTLDRLFHHVEELVEHIEHDALHGIGHVHGNTRHVRRLMAQMEDTLHHLRADVEELRRYSRGPIVPIGGGLGGGFGGYGHGGHYGHAHGRSGGVISFGSGDFRVRIGF